GERRRPRPRPAALSHVHAGGRGVAAGAYASAREPTGWHARRRRRCAGRGAADRPRRARTRGFAARAGPRRAARARRLALRVIDPRRLPFFYGWIVVAVAFVTMGIGVNTRTAFSLLFPPILAEFGWDRAVTAGAFSVGFLVATAYVPFLGMAMDRYGPRVVIPIGIVITSAGLALAPLTSRPWHLHVTLGALVGGGSIFMTYIGHSLFLPHWFVRRRGLAIGIAFSGVGIGSMLLFPWLGRLIAASGWRAACWALVVLLTVVLLPLNVTLPRGRPEDIGLAADGDPAAGTAGAVPVQPVRR